MYDELVKSLREASGGARYTLWWQAADAIEELQQIAAHYEKTAKDYFKDVCYYLERVPKWIPVTERLPGSGVPTLICGGGNVVEQGFFDAEYGYWYDWDGNRTFVHHWMPLPQPPTAEEGET